MKKAYFNPEMVVVKLASKHQLLAGSEKFGFGEGTKSGGSAAARGFDIEFDEEDEDY